MSSSLKLRVDTPAERHLLTSLNELREERMTVYTFILREKNSGAGDHKHKDKRRAAAMNFVIGENCTILDSPQNMQINGVWHYWWFLDIPDNPPGILDNIKTQFTVTNTSVE